MRILFSNLLEMETSKVKIMTNYVRGADKFNQPIGSWDVSRVSDMSFMFTGHPSFNQPLKNWNVSSLTNMNEMFWNNYHFDQDLSDWNIELVTTQTLLTKASRPPTKALSTNRSPIINGLMIGQNLLRITQQDPIPFSISDYMYKAFPER